MNRQAADTQRILWAVVAVSLLVIIVLAGGLYFLRPRGAEATEVAVTEPDESAFDPFEYVRSDQETPGLQETTESPRQVTLVVGDVQSQASSESPMTGPASTPQTSQTAPTPAVVTPATVTQSPASVSRAPVPAAPPAAPAPRATGDFQYWIQVGSFSSRSRADDLHNLLADLGYAGRITAHDSDGVTMHRVRIGPIGSRPEADLMLGKLRTTNEMDGWIAQVRG
ncbi:MAG: SPOR domain-containing protein [Spirochaetaceae bacterium]|nr:SPOR domain-containing protein [Spirochaetaceae bacterium]